MPKKKLSPNLEGDWINQRNPEFEAFMLLGDKGNTSKNTAFETYSCGVQTNRDFWVYNFSCKSLGTNMRQMIDFYNQEIDRYRESVKNSGSKTKIEDFVANDSKKISWSSSLLPNVERGRNAAFDISKIVPALYRPFSKQWLYFDKMMNHRPYLMPRLFPTPRHENIVISVTGIGASKPFSAVVTDVIPNLHLHDTGQCFPLYWYERVEDSKRSDKGGLFAPPSGKPDADGYVRHDAITDWALAEFRKHYQDKSITKEDIFYYIYGLLYSPQYREKYESSLKKMLPRIPFAADFHGFSKAGRALAKLHLGYETVEPWPVAEESMDLALVPKDLYHVEKMVFAKNSREIDRTTIIFNSRIRLTGIPLEAYKYVVNGKSAIAWVMEQYAISVDKDSGIRNDPNYWSDDPRYIIDLVKRVVRVSVETVRIVKNLPAL